METQHNTYWLFVLNQGLIVLSTMLLSTELLQPPPVPISVRYHHVWVLQAQKLFSTLTFLDAIPMIQYVAQQKGPFPCHNINRCGLQISFAAMNGQHN